MGSVTGDCRPGTALIGRAWNSPGEINLRFSPCRLRAFLAVMRKAWDAACESKAGSRLKACFIVELHGESGPPGRLFAENPYSAEISVPAGSPSRARVRAVGSHRLRTRMGSLFSMQREMAVLSITSNCRLSVSI